MIVLFSTILIVNVVLDNSYVIRAADFQVIAIDKCFSSDTTILEIEKCDVGTAKSLDMVGSVKKPMNRSIVSSGLILYVKNYNFYH